VSVVLVKPVYYKHYLLLVLSAILAFNLLDRVALDLLLQDIKVDLDLSDTQLGLLSGFAFALFYSVMGIPIARWADRGNRITIISGTTAIWCAAVTLCGYATSFTQLLLIRVGVAVGEAGCMPPAHSLIADHFNRAERPRAVSRYLLGAPISALIGYLLAGWLNELVGWRVTFMLLGLPGLALALLARLTLREPRSEKQAIARDDARHPTVASSRSTAPSPAAQASVTEVCATLWNNVTLRHLLFCFSIVAFFGSGIQKWQAPFFIRSHGLDTGELGTWFTVIYGVGGIIGMYWGGEIAARLAPDNEPLQLKAMVVVYVAGALIKALVYLAPNHYLAFSLLGVANLAHTAVNGPLLALIQTLVPQHMRATAIAVLYLCVNLIGLGLGPLAAGLLSDALRPQQGEESLRYALLILCPGYLWAAWHCWRAASRVTRDLPAAHVGGADTVASNAAAHPIEKAL
jgi:MFS family permease